MSSTPVAHRAWLLGVFALIASGCDCKGSSNISRSNGEIGVVWYDADGNRLVNRDALFDFGYALVGDKKPMTMTVRNTGAGKLTLTKLELASGDQTAIGGPGDGDFEVDFAPVELEPSTDTAVPMYFTPRGLKQLYESKLTLTAEGARVEDSTATITLRGAGQKGACDLPTEIDFGKVPVGDTLPFEVVYNNPTNVDALGSVGAVGGADAAAFGATPSGDVPVTHQSQVNVEVTFSPTEKRAYSATVKLKGAGNCPEVDVTLKGEGADDVFSWTPDTLDFGFVSPGFDSVKDVLFTNLSNIPITITDVTSSMPTDFEHRVPAGADATRLSIPGGGQPFPMHLACAPAGMGPRTATLTFKTPLKKTPQGTISLKCVGGGPKIKVTPRPTLAFGRVGYFPGNTSFTVTRKVNIQNIGSRPATPTTTANLYLGQVDASGTPGQLPLFDLVPKNAATAADEFTVSLASAYDPAKGLEPIAGKNFVDVGVVLNPKSIGLKEADLVIYSNDSAEPSITVKITADVQQLPPCNYKVAPAQANFGLVTPPTSKDLPITITNLGTAATDVCYLSGIDLAPGSNLAYSIVGGPVVDKELQPQESWQVVVRVAPPGPVPTTVQSLTGVLTFNASSPTKPQASVPLTTAVGPVCLTVTPDPLDFGTVKQGCSSAAKTFNIYNVCSTSVTITGFAMQAPGGQPPGGPNCPGAAACPEFFLVQTPTLPATGLPISTGAAPITFQAKYHPIDLGQDQGAVAITALQGGQSVTYLVNLMGTGDTSGLQTDTFVQDLKPKADILLVIDDSGSMQDKQNNLAANFSSFIQYAVAANVDYQIGVTTTSMQDDPCIGGFCPPNGSVAKAGHLRRDSNGLYILKPTTPNIGQKFSDFVKVGINGSSSEEGLEPAVAALTPPLVAAENAGFLRTDANLAVVVVSDAIDQSPQPVSYYENRLWNVKGFNRQSMFTFNNIGPYSANGMAPSGCTYDSEPASNTRYQTVVTATSGIKDEICTTNWSTTLQNLGRTAFGYRTQFYLNTAPDTSGGKVITVQLNGQNVAPSTTTWTYDSASNSIKFASTATPSPGQTLTVTYTTACFP